jgi:hypothetical protein
VVNGVITLVPTAKNGLLATDTCILTSTAGGVTSFPVRQDVSWVSSGGAVTAGYAGEFVRPGTIVTNPRAELFVRIAEATSTYERGVEDCYVATGALTGCDNGSDGVPDAYVGGASALVATMNVVDGEIVLTPGTGGGIAAAHIDIRTPNIVPPVSGPRLPQDIKWATSGGACVEALVAC